MEHEPNEELGFEYLSEEEITQVIREAINEWKIEDGPSKTVPEFYVNEIQDFIAKKYGLDRFSLHYPRSEPEGDDKKIFENFLKVFSDELVTKYLRMA
ncbi:hypothetical protein KW800_01300 [Candidatus Parcubacteria bacterium]|nr:hypothetical protein [Candidatus Parcubacteria bacterium]